MKMTTGPWISRVFPDRRKFIELSSTIHNFPITWRVARSISIRQSNLDPGDLPTQGFELRWIRGIIIRALSARLSLRSLYTTFEISVCDEMLMKMTCQHEARQCLCASKSGFAYSREVACQTERTRDYYCRCACNTAMLLYIGIYTRKLLIKF